jgi:uncharacterized protein (TIGR00375 family)
MIQIDADLHIHSRYSAATSSMMRFDILAREASRKGIHLVGTGDCLHPEWLSEIKSMMEKDGIFFLGTTGFLLTAEVEDANRVHHLLLIPDISKAEELREKFSKYSDEIDSQGRPRLRLSGEEIADFVGDSEALIGPSHAFTPWTAIYAYHDSLRECYQDVKNISFIELGLSADSSYADRISELREVTFLTNSDAHSPHPNRFAREFNRFLVDELSFDEIKKAILRRGSRRVILNVGIPPQEGKYNESACIRCYTHFSFHESVSRKWRCGCGGRIKKGVRDRVEELSSWKIPKHPEHRPPYLHLIPLAEILSLVLDEREVPKKYEELIREFGSEVEVLVDSELGSGRIDDRRIVDAIKAFRDKRIKIKPGGGGKYGIIALPWRQASLDEY